MADDLLAELRRAHPQSADGDLRHRAADEIERLRAEREREKQSFDLR